MFCGQCSEKYYFGDELGKISILMEQNHLIFLFPITLLNSANCLFQLKVETIVFTVAVGAADTG